MNIYLKIAHHVCTLIIKKINKCETKSSHSWDQNSDDNLWHDISQESLSGFYDQMCKI